MKKLSIVLISLIFLFFISVSLFSQNITVTSPNGGENWKIGSTHNITWNSSGVSGNIIIKLLKGGTMLGSIAWNIPNTGSYSWTINNIGGTPIQAGNDYKVLVRSFDNHSIEDQSNSNFSITSDVTGSITVNTPNGGESWQIGSSHNITWNSTGVSGNVIIKLIKGTEMLGSIAWNVPNTGSYNWTINNIGGTPIQPGNNYKVLVRSFDDHSIEDRSDSNFVIKAGDSRESIKILKPTSMWSFNAGGKMRIEWRAVGFDNMLKILLKKCDNSQLYIVEDRIGSSKNLFEYNIPENLDSGKYYIYIEKLVDKSVNSRTGCFQISKFTKNINVLFPALNSKHLKGEICSIKWFSQNVNSDYVEIQYKEAKDGVLTPLRTIKDSVDNRDGQNTYSWKIPENIEDGNYKILISTPDNKVRGESKTFKILQHRLCDLAIESADFCEGFLDIKVKNYGESFVGNLIFKIHYKTIPFVPAVTIARQKNKFVLFSGKTLNVNFKNLKHISTCSENFTLELLVDKEHKDMNTSNNKYSGKVYKDCQVRDCSKPDLYIKKVYSNFPLGRRGSNSYDEVINAGQKLKVYCDIVKLGNINNTPVSIKMNIKYKDSQFGQISILDYARWDNVQIKGTEKKFKFEFVPQRRGYYYFEWIIDFLNAVDERNENNNKKEYHEFVWERR